MKQKILIAMIFFMIGATSSYFVTSFLNRTAEDGKKVHSSNAAKNQKEDTGIPKDDTNKDTNSPENEISEDTTMLETDADEDARLNRQNSLARIDYPLIDLYFEHDKEYRVVLTKFMQDEICKEYTDTGDFFQQNKGNFSILTIPAGMGTTPPFSLCIYEEGECIKTIDCGEVRTGILDDKW